ncbi:DUF6585 family protein [Streptomyces ziwulingensis]|uniref:NERD domain-containing protein n=1 Tax=Streptomyces ziwulingensis TaxID=1045501 RepID=A0ABP9BXZ9_9ACTN
MSVPDSPSPEAARLAVRHRLGRLDHTFAPAKELDVREGLRGLFLAGSLLGVACLATGGVLLGVHVSWAFGLYPLAVAVLGAGALVNSPNVRKGLGGRRLYLFEAGLVVDMGRGRLFAVRWDQAVLYQETVRHVIRYKDTEAPWGSTHASTLVAPGGARIQISDFFAGHGTWAPLISEAVARAQAPRVWQSVREGRRAAHGPFVLDVTGVAAGRGGVLPWPEVEAIDVHQGVVVVRRRGHPGTWASVQSRTVPNLLAFLTVASNLRSGATDATDVTDVTG